MIHKNYILRIYESVNHKNSRIMQIIDNTAEKVLNNGEEKRTVVFGSHICDSEFFQKYFCDVQEISADFYRFICSQFDFVPIPQYLFQDTEYGAFRTATMGLDMRKDMSTKEKYGYFLDHESKPKTVYYHCDDLTGILLSELHYYVFGGYKLTECRLCGRKFFTKSLKTQFCLRTGFDEKRPQYSCNHIASSQRNNRCANVPIKKKRKVIVETLRRRDEEENGNSLVEFYIKDQEMKSSKIPSDYEQWILEQHKIFVPNGKM